MKLILIIAIYALLLPPYNAIAKQVSFYETNPDFNPNNLISDSSITDFNSLTIEQIRDFTNEQGGTLGTYIDPETNMPAYWLIWQSAQEFKINPKFILTMLQKEQSIVSDPSPTQNQYNWAVGYSCYGGVCLDIYKGFSRQIRGMSNKIINGYLADLNERGKHKSNFFCTFTKWCIGDAKETQDQQLIIPENKATAALYTYNPYRGGTVVDGYKVGANYNFWKIWTKWFNQKIIRPTGTILKTAASEKVYLIQNGFKRAFANFSAFITRYKIDDIKIVESAELDQYQIGQDIKFSQYSLLKDSAGNIFLLVDDTLRKIASMEVFRTLGLNPEEVEDIADQDLTGLKNGTEITITSSFPTGALIQDAKTGGIYYVESGIKYPILAKEIIKYNFLGKKIISINPLELEKYPKGEAVKFKDGALVKLHGDERVFVISGGKKLPIADEKAFISRGYDWNKIIETSETALEIHPTGGMLEYLDTSLLKKTTQNPDNITADEEIKTQNIATTSEKILTQ